MPPVDRPPTPLRRTRDLAGMVLLAGGLCATVATTLIGAYRLDLLLGLAWTGLLAVAAGWLLGRE